MIRVKICGIASRNDLELCVDAGADALGFIFAESARKLSVDEAAALTALVPPFVTAVGVFAGCPAGLVRDALARCRLDVLQFAGDETPEFCGSFGKPTMLVARSAAPKPEDLHVARAIAVLADAHSPDAFGGTGLPVDYEVARRIKGAVNLPFVLAGGLTLETVARAIRAVRPHGVDVRTGVERAGAKDPQLVRGFVRAAKAASEMEG